MTQEGQVTTDAVNAAQQAFVALKLAQLEYMKAEIEFARCLEKVAGYTLSLDKHTQDQFDAILNN